MWRAHDGLKIAGEGAAEYGLVDQIDAEAGGVGTGRVRNIVAELIFLLVALDREICNGGGELIVAEGFQSRSREETHGKRKVESFADHGVSEFGVMEPAGFQRERAKPGWQELKLVVQEKVVVVRIGRGAGGGQSALLEEIVLRAIAIKGAANEPLRAQGLRPIGARGKKRVAERHGHGSRNGADRGEVRKLAGAGEL